METRQRMSHKAIEDRKAGTLKAFFARYRRFAGVLIILWSIGIFWNCANIGMPDGGMKDETPPKFLGSTPPNFSVNFSESRIILEFDEYIVQKDLNNQLLVSPPVKNKPIIKFKGKKIQIDLMSELEENTTYTINFGNAIVDNNEGNALPDFQYVFATGPIIDSLQITGIVKDAYTLEAIEGAVVMLYKDLSDTAIFTSLPYYVARSLKDGSFGVKNIADTTYQIMALVDNNQNYLYDLAEEKIAFIDSFLRPSASLEEITDTLTIKIEPEVMDEGSVLQESENNSELEDEFELPEKNTELLSDSIAGINLTRDSIVVRQVTRFDPSDIGLTVFTPLPEERKLLSRNRIEKSVLELVFNRPHRDSLMLEFPGFDSNTYLQDINLTRDSVLIWLTDSNLYRQDSILLLLGHFRTDSTGKDSFGVDSLQFIYRSREQSSFPEFKLISNVRSGSVYEMNQTFNLFPTIPISGIDTSKLYLRIRQDTLWVDYPFQIQQSEKEKRKYSIAFTFEGGNAFQFQADSSAFTDIYQQVSDSLFYMFEVRKKDFYGKLILNVTKKKEYPYLVQLLTDKKVLVEEKILTETGVLEYDYLLPGNYKLRIIHDQNSNGKWDTGDYRKKIQPEPIEYPEVPIGVKSNWDVEVEVNGEE